MTDAASLTERLQELIEFIEKANHSMDEGAVPSLGNLDQTVALLCSDVEKSEPEIARQAQPLMAQMITKLDELAVKLQNLQQADQTKKGN